MVRLRGTDMFRWSKEQAEDLLLVLAAHEPQEELLFDFFPPLNLPS